MVKEVLNKITIAFQKISFWLLLVFLVGFLCGSYAMDRFVAMKMEDAKKLNGIVINNIPYDLKQRL
jgi:hypothetical protein